MKKNTRRYLGDVIADAVMNLDVKDLLCNHEICTSVDLSSPITISLSDVDQNDFYQFEFARVIMEQAKAGFEPRSDDGSHVWANELRELANKIEEASKKAWKIADKQDAEAEAYAARKAL